MSTDPEADDLKTAEALRLLWDEFSLRQGHYWRSANRFSLVIITLSVVPYVQQNVVDTLGPVGIGIIVVSCLFSFLAAWLLYAEYLRLASIREVYNRALPERFRRVDFDGPRTTGGRFSRSLWPLLCYPIGRATSAVFAWGFGLVTHLNLLVYAVYKLRYSPPGATAVLATTLALESALFTLWAWIARRRVRRLAREGPASPPLAEGPATT